LSAEKGRQGGGRSTLGLREKKVDASNWEKKERAGRKVQGPLVKGKKPIDGLAETQDRLSKENKRGERLLGALLLT